MKSEVAKVMFIIDGVVERKTSRFLESLLSPMLDFPCFVQVVADHVMAFELAMLQDFHAIVLPHRSSDKCFSSDAFAEIIKTIRGFSASLIYTIDSDNDLFACQGHPIVHTSCTGGFDIEELVQAIASVVDEPPSAEVSHQAMARVVSTDPQDACYVQAAEVPQAESAAMVASESVSGPGLGRAPPSLRAADKPAARRKRSRKDSEASTSSVPSHHAQTHPHTQLGHVRVRDPQQQQGQEQHSHHADAQASHQYWAYWQQHLYQQSQFQQAQQQAHAPPQTLEAAQASTQSTKHTTHSTHPAHPSSTTPFFHPPHPHSSQYPAYGYGYSYPHAAQGNYHYHHQAHPAHSAAHPAHHAHSVYGGDSTRSTQGTYGSKYHQPHHGRSDSTTEEACSISSEEEEPALRLSTSSAESAADFDLEGFDEMVFCISNIPAPC